MARLRTRQTVTEDLLAQNAATSLITPWPQTMIDRGAEKTEGAERGPVAADRGREAEVKMRSVRQGTVIR